MGTQEMQPAVVVKQDPLLREDLALSDIEIPTSELGRAELRVQIEKELRPIKQEQHALKTCSTPAEAPTSVNRVTKFMMGRARALNPIRDFDKIGFSVINDGDNPWEYCAAGNPLAWGIMAPLVSGLVTGLITSNAPLAIGVGVFAAAPLFLSSFAIRTAFNLAAGFVTAVAAPLSYAFARINDVRHNRGYLTAKEFLTDLEDSHLDKEEKAKMIMTRRSLLEQNIWKREQVLGKIDAPMAEEQKARLREMAEEDKTRLNEKWLKGVGRGGGS